MEEKERRGDRDRLTDIERLSGRKRQTDTHIFI